MKSVGDKGQRPVTQSSGTPGGGGSRHAQYLAEVVGPGGGRFTSLPGAEGGQTTVMMALFLATFLFGFVAMAVDVQNLFHAKRMAQSAADAAAVAAAEELTAGNSSNEQTVANAMARLNGFDTNSAKNPATVTLGSPSAGNSDGSTANYVVGSFVQVTVSKPIPTYFMGIINGKRNLVVAATAVAGGGLSSPTCVCIMGASGTTLTVDGGSPLTAKGCGVTVNSNSNKAAEISGGGSVDALALGTEGSVNLHDMGTISNSTKVIQGLTTGCSPSVTVPKLPPGIACYNNPVLGWNPANNNTGIYNLPLAGETPTNNTICFNSLDTSQSAKVNFATGYTYYIKGDFTTGGGSPLSGSGVTFYVGGNVNIANGVTANLLAPTVGSPAIPQTLFYAMGSTVMIQGGSNSNLSGLVYAPNAAVTMNNGSGTVLNMDFVAQSLILEGGATLNSYSTSNLGSLNFSTAKLTE